MKRRPAITAGAAAITALVIASLVAVGAAQNQVSAAPPASPVPGISFEPTRFGHVIDNPYMPLLPEMTYIYEGAEDGEHQHDVVSVTNQTKTIMGVACVVVHDSVFDGGGHLLEDTFDWYAQDAAGNVWYFGEDTKEYENGKVKSTEGSWEAGVDGARPGVIMPASPVVGLTYQQEYSSGEAEDLAQVLKLGDDVNVRFGSFNNVLVTKEWTPLEPGVVSQKYYAPGIGVVLEETVQGGQERSELVAILTASGTPVATPIR